MDEDGLNEVVVDFVEVHLGEGLGGRGGADAAVPLDDLLRADMLVFLTSLGLFHLWKKGCRSIGIHGVYKIRGRHTKQKSSKKGS